MKEPKALNTLADESERLSDSVREELPRELPNPIESLFSPLSDFFEEEVIARWRMEERFDELIDFLVYQYAEFDGHPPWEQVLLDLRIKGEEARALKLLERLLEARLEMFEDTVVRIAERPDHLGARISHVNCKASILKLLYEVHFIVANKREHERDDAAVAHIEARIVDILER